LIQIISSEPKEGNEGKPVFRAEKPCIFLRGQTAGKNGNELGLVTWE
jgi:hypothetical protein